MNKTLKKKNLKPIETSSPLLEVAKKKGWLTRLPIIKQKYRKEKYPRGFDVEAGQYIPLNLKVGEYESEVIPLILIDYFIEKAGTIVIRNCPCRARNECKNHDINLGCIWMGKGAANLDLENLPGINSQGRYATKEEAREHARLALKNGLVPAMGKLRGDAVVYNVLEYEDELMDFCFCCSCCCITAGLKYGNSDYKKVVKRMEGLTLSVSEKCNMEMCEGECFKACIYNAMRLKRGKAVINQDNCIGCGFCETKCPINAISLSYDENVNIDEVMEKIIKRYEKIVDISG